MTRKEKEAVVDLLKAAKDMSGNSMPIIVHLPSQDAIDFANTAIKGRRGFKHISFKLKEAENV
jgi:hypothetical protein